MCESRPWAGGRPCRGAARPASHWPPVLLPESQGWLAPDPKGTCALKSARHLCWVPGSQVSTRLLLPGLEPG